ncbi:DUF2213 domain-containing protein [Pseudomonas laurylsulfatiphila]|uniref:DUF2213 domain-containing protein n=1 Tax=Pseudomonas laurylsulfatiphila TaxID=2011015 RepID=UPI003D1C2D89
MLLKNTLGLVMCGAIRFNDEADAGHKFQDKLHMPTKRKFKMSGQMIAPCTIARTGIMEYQAKDLGAQFKDHAPESIIKVMTLPEDLFDEASIDSYRAAPFTVGHPKDDVDTENAKELMKGMLEGTPCKDESGEELVGTMVLNDADTIALVRSNVNQLSSGHNAVLVLCDFDTVGYHAKKTNIRANHIAIVPKGRAGVASIADSVEEEVIDDVAVIPAVIETAKVVDAVVEIKVGDAALIAEVETLKAKLDDVTAKLADALAVGEKLKDIDAQVEERMAFVSEALALADVDVKGLTKLEVMRAVVTKVCPTAPTSMSDQYVEVRYGILLEDKDFVKDQSTDVTQVLRDTIGVITKPVVTPAKNETAREAMIKRNEGAK